MTRTLDFYYDFLSPYSYLAFTRLPALAQAAGATIAFKPIDVIEVMERVGNAPTTVLCAAKGRYALADMARWAGKYGVPITRNPHFRSIAGRPLLLGAVAAARIGQAEAYSRAIFEGVWTKQAAFADDAQTLEVLREGGFKDAEAVLAARDDAEGDLQSLIDEATKGGVFGVPSFKVGEALFFGNDRLSFVEEALAP